MTCREDAFAMTWLTTIKFNLLDIVPVTVQGLVNYDPSADTWIMSRDEIYFRLISAAHFSSLHTWLLHNFLFSFHIVRLHKGYQNIATTCSSPIGALTIFGAVEYIFRFITNIEGLNQHMVLKRNADPRAWQWEATIDSFWNLNPAYIQVVNLNSRCNRCEMCVNQLLISNWIIQFHRRFYWASNFCLAIKMFI